MKTLQLQQDTPVTVNPPSAPSPHYTYYANPQRMMVEDGNGNWLATFTHGARTVSLRGPRRTFTQQDLPITDDFSRVCTSGWGQATFGGKWYASGGDIGTEYAVDGDKGTIVVSTENVSRRVTVSNGSDIQDAEVVTSFVTNKTARGSAQVAGIIMGYQNTDNHYIAQLSFIPALVTDTFNRTVIGGWGTANSDQTWSTSGGSASDYSVSGSTGLHSVSAVNVSRRTLLSSINATDFDMTVKVAPNALASGASIAGAILGRYIDSNNHYLFRIRFSSLAGNSIFASIQKQEGGITTTLGSEAATALTHTAGASYWVRAQATGTTLRLRLWADGAGEPTTWDISLSDNTFTGPGAIGLRSILTSGNTNMLPVVFAYDYFEATLDGRTADSVEVRLRKRLDGTYTSIGTSYTLPGTTHMADDVFYLRATMHGGILQARAWKQGGSEPITWHAIATDSSFTAGRIGVRATCNIGTTNLPVSVSWHDLWADGTWADPPMVRHDMWVRLLPVPFSGIVDEPWLIARLQDVTPDILAVAMQYITHAPAVTAGGLQVAGDAGYGPLLSDGSRQEGADFNDYLGIVRQYGSYTDVPETSQFRCMDCSGFVRMVFGYRGSMGMTSSVIDGVSIPRVSYNIANNGPGVIVASGTGTPPGNLSALLPGDIVCFDADSSNPDEGEGQIDHNGIYLGLDIQGKHRFISSRKTIDGPSLSDTGGPSILDGTGLYARSLRIVRRF